MSNPNSPSIRQASLKGHRGFYVGYGTHGGSWNNLAMAAGTMFNFTTVTPIICAFTSSPGGGAADQNPPDLSVARSSFPAVAAMNASGQLFTLFAGGSNRIQMSDVVDIFYHSQLPPTTETLPDRLSLARQGHAAVNVNNTYILFVGGTELANGSTASNVIDVFSVSTLRRIRTLSLLEPRKLAAAAALGPFVYIGGGSSQIGILSVRSQTVEVIDTRSWGQFFAENLTVGAEAIGVVSTPIGVLFIGGYPASNKIDVYSCGNGARYSDLHPVTASILIEVMSTFSRSLTV